MGTPPLAVKLSWAQGAKLNLLVCGCTPLATILIQFFQHVGYLEIYKKVYSDDVFVNEGIVFTKNARDIDSLLRRIDEGRVGGGDLTLFVGGSGRRVGITPRNTSRLMKIRQALMRHGWGRYLLLVQIVIVVFASSPKSASSPDMPKMERGPRRVPRFVVRCQRPAFALPSKIQSNGLGRGGLGETGVRRNPTGRALRVGAGPGD